ncbi:MAG: RNA 2',3'-cyclic phosphodiesterase [Thiobacillus sp.]|nr:RNA 2',3'-cyclic phosphodiesterase [Thiobacillus sp.]
MTESERTEPGLTEPGLIETGPAKPVTQRLFFALWPDTDTRYALNRTGKWLHQHWGGRRMRADTLHLTLAFLGDLTAAQLDALLQGIRDIPVGAFELCFDQAGHWPHNRIGWLGLSQPCMPLENLVLALRDQLRALEIPFDARRHTPHITLLRKAQGGAALECLPVNWTVDGFVLVASNPQADGAHYDVLQTWRLAP